MNDFIIQFLTMITSEFHNRLNDNNFRFNLFFLVFSVGVTPLIKIWYTKAFKSIKRIATKEQDKSHLESSETLQTKYIDEFETQIPKSDFIIYRKHKLK